MKLIILSNDTDIHGDAVKWAMERIGHTAHIYSLEAFPADQTVSLRPTDSLKLGSHGVLPETYDVEAIVWRRRISPPTFDQRLHPSDIVSAKLECKAFTADLLELLTRATGRWVNENTAAWRATSKSYQLAMAKECGFNIPATLISNDAQEILAFCRSFGGTIASKSYYPRVWDAPERKKSYIAATSLVKTADLQNMDSLKACPTIYQEYIQKDFEIRATVFGRDICAVKILSQSTRPTVDWRYDRDNLKPWPIEPFNLSERVKDKIFSLMDSMGLTFGCVDFIVTPKGEYIFLEINEQGQFLWIEDLIPKTNLLERFVSFILNASVETGAGISFHKYLESGTYEAFRGRIAKSDNEHLFSRE